MANRLAVSTSPYLRQHADNPVDWHEWGEEAFAAARDRDVPVLLSVGYSSCHWCHVMAHESFEDPAIAAVMNDLFVNVKVDREERPDVDSVYMEAVQAMTGRGGWPMTVWLTPDGRPFYAGTYFPKTDRHGMPAFQRVMQAVHEAWTERRDDIGEQATRLTDAISRTIPAAETLPSTEALATGFRRLEGQYDPVEGGFGDAPKFPQQPVLEFLLRVHREPWASHAPTMVRQTLRKIARGGIRDHVGGGFARYSVDRIWLVPHFEKMLYDNAQLARLYLRAWQELGEADFLAVALETLEYLRRDLRHPDGGFYSAEDADSEGEEGRFYVWDSGEFRRVLGDDAALAATYFGVTPEGNFEDANVLHEARTVREVAEESGLDDAEVRDRIESAKRALFAARQTRERPGLDHKIVASWNGLALRAFAEAGAVLRRADLLADARACARFLLDNLVDGDRVLRSWSEGEARIAGFLEDHASLAMGLFALYAATGEVEWYRAAETITRAIPELFTDPAGGFYTTAADAEALVKRPKDQMDNPLPSGNSLAAEALLLLSLYTGDGSLREAAESAIRAGGAVIERHPSAVGHLMGVLWSIHRGPKEVAVVGPGALELAGPVWDRFRPEVALAVDATGDAADTVPLLEARWQDGRTLAYVCERFVCTAPTADPDQLRSQLDH